MSPAVEPTKLGPSQQREILAAYRKPNSQHPISGKPLVPNPLEILALREALTLSLPEMEKYAILEQLFTAAVESGNQVLAKSFLDQISSKFSVNSSGRVQVLYGMYHESLKDYEVAQGYYEMALETDELNCVAAKRKMALLLAQGSTREAIRELVQYLDVFMQDTEAWSQLSQLYIQEHMYQQAAFCIEELLLHRPHNPFYQVRYADLQTLMGDYPLAIKYYSLTMLNCEDHPRALYGMYNACALLIKSLKEGKETTSRVGPLALDVAEDLLELAKERLQVIYKGDSDFRDRGLESVVNTWLESIL